MSAGRFSSSIASTLEIASSAWARLQTSGYVDDRKGLDPEATVQKSKTTAPSFVFVCKAKLASCKRVFRGRCVFYSGRQHASAASIYLGNHSHLLPVAYRRPQSGLLNQCRPKPRFEGDGVA